MNVSPVASSEKVQSALTNLGIPDGFVAYDVVPLLQQLVVALGNVTGGGGGGSAVWGDITGTLSNQTDLQNALDAKSNIINVPRVIYVSTFGNDTTGNGSLSKPFLTVDHAVNQVTGPTRIVLAGGDYTVDANAVSLSAIEIVGQGGVGFNQASSDLAVTKLVISGVGANGTNSAGAGGAPVYLTASQIYLEINSYGGNVDADDGSTYSAGSGGNVHIEGDCDVVISNYGGSAGTLDNGSVVNGGSGGDVTLGRGVRLAAPIGTTVAIYSGAGTNGGGGVDGTAGNLTADACDLRTDPINIVTGTITLGRCSYTNGLSINNDKGGNASW